MLLYITLIFMAFNYPLIREHILREMPLDICLNFFFVEKGSFLCWWNIILCVSFAQNFIFDRIYQVTTEEHIKKTHLQDRRHLSSSILQTKSTGSENSVSKTYTKCFMGNFFEVCLFIDFIFEGIPIHDSKNNYKQVGATKDFVQETLHSKIVFKLALPLS